MVMLGVDAHKATHTIVASDANGCELDRVTVRAVDAGHLDALAWAARWPDRMWAIEDCRQLTRRLERALLVAGETVVRVTPRLMAVSRQSGRRRGKSDPIDALAVARAAIRERDLPRARLDGPDRELRLLLDHREDLVEERTRTQNRLRWHLHELDPDAEPPVRALSRRRVIGRLRDELEGVPGTVARLARDLVERIDSLNHSIETLEAEIAALVEPMAPTLLAVSGCGALTAAKIIAETADIHRFHSAAAFAMYNGTAPIPVWSSNAPRHRLNRGGNRQLNCALHRIAVTQLRWAGPGRTYFERRIASGDTKKEALRALRRRLSDVTYRALRADTASSWNTSELAA
jgi:transposase